MRIVDVVLNKLINVALSIVRRFLQSPQQLTFCGQGSTEQSVAHIVRSGSRKVLLVTDKPLVELGLAGNEDEVLERLGADAAYPAMFEAAFPADPQPVTIDNITRAIASFERTLISGEAPYFRWVYGDDRDALGPAARGDTHLDRRAAERDDLVAQRAAHIQQTVAGRRLEAQRHVGVGA